MFNGGFNRSGHSDEGMLVVLTFSEKFVCVWRIFYVVIDHV